METYRPVPPTLSSFTAKPISIVPPEPPTPVEAASGKPKKERKQRDRFGSPAKNAMKASQFSAQVVNDVRNMEVRYKKDLNRLRILMKLSGADAVLFGSRNLTDDDLKFADEMIGPKSAKGGN